VVEYVRNRVKSRRPIEFESSAHGWTLKIPSPSNTLISELVALEPKRGVRETASELIERIMRQLAAVLRTATSVRMASDESSASEKKLTAEVITLEEAGHILQTVRAEHTGADPSTVIIWLKDERILSFSRRGMGQMQLGALATYAKRLESMQR
jgi:hypothetical protein